MDAGTLLWIGIAIGFAIGSVSVLAAVIWRVGGWEPPEPPPKSRF